jgi:hypothetical protein
MYRIFFLVFLMSLSTAAQAQVAHVITLADSLVGAVGGIAVDRTGDIFSADFRDAVWRIKPDGRVSKFAEGFYGASGNFFDARGNLMQANFYGDSISRIDRTGEHEPFVEEGLNGPVGITILGDGSMFVCNCRGNTISRVDEDRVAREFASGDLFRCPNGITSTPDGLLWVVNFSDGNIIKIDSLGNAEVHATVPGPGNGHIAFARGSLYVTAFQSHRLFRVGLDGEVELVAGDGTPGELDGAPEEARFIFPNGIAVSPSGDRLFVNDFINRSPPALDVPPVPMANVRLIKLANLTDRLAAALRAGGIEEMRRVHTAFRADPATAGRFTQTLMNAMGYRLLQGGNLAAAIAVFEMNVADYPAAFNPYDSLAEAYLAAGRKEESLVNYRKSLELNPGNQNARDAIARIEGG